MSIKRAQGRPARGPDEVGRDRIVEGMRAALRSVTRGDITRNDIAHYAGVTPALISYYFPDREELVLAATKPVLEEYWIELRDIMETGCSPQERLRELIRLLVRCHHKDARLLQAFGDFMATRRSASCPDYLAMMVENSAAVVEKWLETLPPCSYGSEFLKDAIWGMCEYLARKSASTTVLAEQPGDLNAKPTQAYLIYELLTVGVQQHERSDPAGLLFKTSPHKRRELRGERKGLRKAAPNGNMMVHGNAIPNTSPSPDESAYD